VDIALEVSRQWKVSVHPCRVDNKRPSSEHGFLDASDDPATIRKLFGRRAVLLVGVACRRDWCVLDLDPNKEGSRAIDWLDEQAERLPPTFSYATRSGGTHFVFCEAHGVRNSESRIAPCVNFRGEGGHAIAWWAHGCSVICNAPVAPMPDWLRDLALWA
jgi:hypothetical protein